MQTVLASDLCKVSALCTFAFKMDVDVSPIKPHYQQVTAGCIFTALDKMCCIFVCMCVSVDCKNSLLDRRFNTSQSSLSHQSPHKNNCTSLPLLAVDCLQPFRKVVEVVEGKTTNAHTDTISSKIEEPHFEGGKKIN